MQHSRILIKHLPNDVAIIIGFFNEHQPMSIGGCRQMHYPSIEAAILDAFALSRAMALKNKSHRLPCGGAKSVIYNPNQVPFNEIAPAFAEMLNELNGKYYASIDIGTGGNEIDTLAKLTPFVYGSLSQSDPSKATALGVTAVIHYLIDKHLSHSEADTHIAIQGLGKVGMAVALDCLKAGMRVTATDINTDLVDKLCSYPGFTASTQDKILATPCDILVPAACGNVINESNIAEINTRYICPIANNPLCEPAVLSEQLKARGIEFIPDFISNGGGLIFAVKKVTEPDFEMIDTKEIVNTLDHFMQLDGTTSLYNKVMQALTHSA
jgi:leucine dehydrogenase